MIKRPQRLLDIRSNRSLWLESLESRSLFDASGELVEASPSPAWFAHFDQAENAPFDNIPLGADGAMSESRRVPFVGPRASVHSEWIVRFNSMTSIENPTSLDIGALLNENSVQFELIRGLGVPGLVQVRSFATTAAGAESALANKAIVKSFQANDMISGERFPNDSDFGNLVGLHNVGQFGAQPDADIDAVEAWNQTVGSPTVVVGVVDSGIDVTHPDLYLNVWINQGEILASKREGLQDTDSDGLITFYDLNSPINASLVRDLNSNGYIDAIDLLQDPLWSDGLDTDHNGFIDDFFGWNFRTGSNEPFAPNNPSDTLGHGTHVAGTIGAIGNNTIGVTGVNWKTSLMSLKFLDQNNQGDTASAIAAINYATMMRTQFDTNVRVLNSSWGQSGSPNNVLRNSIQAAGNSGILLVAAAGNGNVLGQGVDNDRTPFYPASYDLEGIIAVAASDSKDSLAAFSNFGGTSVDIAAPGVGIRSTLPGGRYGEANGTSMATPMVSGTAALIWSELPQASVAEVRKAILESADSKPEFASLISSGGRLNASGAVASKVFSPTATVVSVNNISTVGSGVQEITVQYSDRNGLDKNTIGDDDLVIQHQWGNRETFSASLKSGSVHVASDVQSILATYLMTAPGGVWDPLDFGTYSISTAAGSILSLRQKTPIRSQTIGSFQVKIIDPTVSYVDVFGDSLDGSSLRSAIALSNSNPTLQRTIILEAGRYTIDIPHQSNSSFGFGSVRPYDFCSSSPAPSGWSDSTNGDFDVQGKLTIVGDSHDLTAIDGKNLDRVFKVHQGASLSLQRLTITGGDSPAQQGGGGILSAGHVELDQVLVKGNRALGTSAFPNRGGGIAMWGGDISISESQISENQSDFGGGVFLCGQAAANTNRSTIDNNRGGGFVSYSTADSTIENSTISSNFGGAIISRARDFAGGLGMSYSPTISRDGKQIAYLSNTANLVQGDTNANSDVFVYDTTTQYVTRASVSSAQQQANKPIEAPAINGDGSKIAFLSASSTLAAGDDLFSKDVFIRDRSTNVTTMESRTSNTSRDARGVPAISDDGNTLVFQQSVADDAINSWGVFVADRVAGTRERVQLNVDSDIANIAFLNASGISGDGRFVTIASGVSGTPDENFHDIYIYDRNTKTLEKPDLRLPQSIANGSNYDPSLNYDGRFMAFVSDDTGLIVGDTNNTADVFIYDRVSRLVTRVSQTKNGTQANGASSSPALSSDGKFIAFSSDASNLIAGDNNALSDVFVVDRSNGNIERISVANDLTEANGGSFSPSISGDGRFVVFESEANNLDASPIQHRTPAGPAHRQVYLFDRVTRTTKSISDFNQPSTLRVSNSTVVFNTGDETVSGNVETKDSLYAGNLVGFDFGANTASLGNNVLASASAQGALKNSDIIERTLALNLGKFSSLGQLPPGYPLLQGNPAIDSASRESDGSLDQWNRPRVQSDVGALEAVSAIVKGSVFADLNANSTKDANEQGLPELTVFVDSHADGVLQADEQSVKTTLGADNTADGREQGSYALENLAPGKQNIRVLVPTEWQASAEPIQRVGLGTVQGNGPSSQATTSASGRVVAFVSTANNLVSGDDANPNIFVFDRGQQSIVRVPIGGTNLSVLGIVGQEEQYVLLRSGDLIYLFDRRTTALESISVSNTGELANAHSDSASASSDGEWIAFSSFANNIVPNDTDNFADVFLYNRTTRSVESITTAANGVQGNNDSEEPRISSDGRFVAFISDASNLVPNDHNGLGDAFLYDRVSRSIQRVNVSNSGAESNSFTFPPALSGNGRYVVFQSLASNLVVGDTNRNSDLFVYDRITQTTERLSVSLPTGSQTNVSPSLSEDGQYVVFDSLNSVLSNTDRTTTKSVFVYDRFATPNIAGATAPLLSLVSKSLAGQVNDGDSLRANISSDGRSIVFESRSSNLVANDTNQLSDIFISPNPYENANRAISLQVGQELNSLDIGLVPNPGQILGAVFEDLSSNGVLEEGEPGLSGWAVYLDLNANNRRDVGEPTAISQSDGSYRFGDVPSFRSYVIGIEVPSGWDTTTLPTTSSTVFLQAGGTIEQRNYGFKKQGTTGQFENARIEGRVFADNNNDGIQQSNEFGTSGVEVYLDLNGNESRDFDEPRNVTDSLGNYFFANLGSRTYTVRTVLAEGTNLTSPLGNRFGSSNQSFSANSTALSKPQDVILDDFDGKNGPDVVVALYSGNAIVVQLNDGNGKLQAPVQVSVTPNGQGPTALASGQLNRLGSTDLVVANSLNSTVSVFLDFNTSGFTQSTVVSLGASPTDIKLADMDSDGDLDILVSTQSGSQTGQIRILLNDGNGLFTLGPTIGSGGKRPVSLVAGDFNGDRILDIAVANQGDFGRTNDNGNVAVLLGRSGGGFEAPATYIVGASPLSIDLGDLNGDGFQDLVAVNFSVNTASILRGSASGAFAVLQDQLSVGQGPVQVSIVDIDGDQDKDILVSNLRSKSISILRNRFSQDIIGNPNGLVFEPAESFGVAEISIGPRLVFATADMDRSGTMDMALINSETNSLQLLSNELIGGAHRMQLTGVGTTSNQNFGMRSQILKPRLDPISGPVETLEDTASVSIPLTGIARGRSSGPPLRVTVNSSNSLLIPNPVVNYVTGAANGRIDFVPASNANGTALLNVVVRDAGADGVFDTLDDGAAEQSVSVIVKPVNDPPTVQLRGNQIATLGSNLRRVANFASAFASGGGSDEQSQSIAEYLVSNDRTDLFLVQPAIDNDGNLRFQAGLTRTGIAAISVQVRDNGGTVFGGMDRSVVQTFQITITDLADGEIDFGDAPTSAQSLFASSYPTQLKDNGARHVIGSLYLGSFVDNELDGQPAKDALGDDINGNNLNTDDEDGIVFAVSAIASLNVPTLSSVVAYASADAKLDAWIDFNQDGDWNDSGEQILASVSVVSGPNLVAFTIPAGAKAGTTFSRFRLSSAGGLTTTGQAEDGEVEDYPFSILGNQASNTLIIDSSEIGDHQVSILDGQLIVRSTNKPIFSAPVSNIGRLKFASPTGPSTYEILSPGTNLFGTLDYSDIGRNVTIATSNAKVDLTTMPAGALLGLRNIDLSADVPQEFFFNASNIASLNADKFLGIVLGNQDTLQTVSPWVLSNRQIEQNASWQVFQQGVSAIKIHSPTSWQNPTNRFDADGDGRLSPLDVLVIINHLNRLAGSNSNSTLPVFDPANPLGQFFVDVNGSNSCEPLDVLEVINQINRAASGSGEGEPRVSDVLEPWSWGETVRGIQRDFDEEDRNFGAYALSRRLDQAFAEFAEDWFS
jgi:subtilisin family serine protease/Tol biopolymer transport system component